MNILLTRDGHERRIVIQSTDSTAEFIQAIRAQVPDRRWQIAETWPA
jgi:hypothetical protein